MRVATVFSAAALAAILQGCTVNPSLKYDFVPAPAEATDTHVRKIVVMKPLDYRGHAGTTTRMQAYIPLWAYVRQIREPEAFTYEWNHYRFDYEKDFAELVALDLQSAGIADNVVASSESKRIDRLVTGPLKPDYIVKLTLERMEWQSKFTLYGVSVIGYLPEAFGAPDEYGFSYLSFSAEILDAQGRPLAKRSFQAMESQNGWLYYFTGFLRALTRAYVKISPELRQFIVSTISESTSEALAAEPPPLQRVKPRKPAPADEETTDMPPAQPKAKKSAAAQVSDDAETPSAPAPTFEKVDE